MYARLLKSLAWPAALPVVAAALVVRAGQIPGAPELWQLLPHIVCAATVALAWRFDRSRVVFAAILLWLAGGALGLGAANWVALLLPVTLLVLALLPETGLLTVGGVARWLALAGLIWLVGHPTPSLLVEPLFPFASTLPQIAIALFAVTALVLLLRLTRRRPGIDAGFLGALAAIFLALHTPPDSAAFALYHATAGAVLLLGLVETSYSLAFRDELTGLPGRLALDEALAKQSGRYVVAMVDIDHFKKFNDKHGHDAGDDVLRLVAAKLARVGGGGRAFRYGGEEFTLLFVGSDMEQAMPHVEALCTGIAKSKFTIRAFPRPTKKPQKKKAPKKRKTVRVTVSIGVAHREKKETAEQALKRADQALYKSKKGGRNRVTAAKAPR